MVSSPEPYIFEVQSGRAFGDMHSHISSDTVLIHGCWGRGKVGRSRAIGQLVSLSP